MCGALLANPDEMTVVGFAAPGLLPPENKLRKSGRFLWLLEEGVVGFLGTT